MSRKKVISLAVLITGLWGLYLMGRGSLPPTVLTTCQLAAGRAVTQTYYVAPHGSDLNPGTEALPFKTVQRARDVVRTVNVTMRGDIVIYLREGRYELPETLHFDQSDSGANGHDVIYQSYPGETVSISGGHILPGWIAVGDGTYKAPVSALRFRQLYVNGRRAIRARTPNEGFYYRLIRWDTAAKTIIVNISEIANWERRNEVEMVVQKHWDQNRLRISSLSAFGSETAVVPREPERSRSFSQSFPPRSSHQTYHFENAHEFLDAEGEWYLHSGTNEVFYKPRAGEDMATAVVVAPRLETLVRIVGTLDDPVHNIQFCGLNFEHSSWLLPSDEGYVGMQANRYDGGGLPAGIHIQNADRLTFERNVFRHMGAMGIVLHSGTHDNRLIGNVVFDTAGNGIVVDWNLVKTPSDDRLICKRDVIRNNYITRVGQDYYGSVGIFGGYTEALEIDHNEVSHMPYTGISVGWGWTMEDTALGANKIRYNLIHGVMNLRDDGAGIYMLSHQPETLILGNYIHNIYRSHWADKFAIQALYLDEGSSFITVKNNVVEDVPLGIFLHRAHHNTLINHTGTIKSDGSSNNTEINNGYIVPSQIKSTAGIETSYVDIKEEIPDSNPGETQMTVWMLNETSGLTAQDASGQGNHGSLVGGTTWVSGRLDGGLGFNGVDSYVEVANHPSLSPQQLTAALWFKATSFANSNWNSTLLNKGQNEWTDGYYGLAVTTSGQPVALLNIGGDVENAYSVFTYPLNTGEWYHLAFTYDGHILKLYVNGSLVEMQTIEKPHSRNTENLFLGRRGDGGYFFNGVLDDVRLYGRALTASEISGLAALEGGHLAPQMSSP